MNCNCKAFDWIIQIVKIKTNYSEDPKYEQMTEKQI